MKHPIINDDTTGALYQPAGLIRAAAKTIYTFLDASDLQLPSNGELNGFDAMKMTDLIIEQVQKVEHATGELERLAREQENADKPDTHYTDDLSVPAKAMLKASTKNQINEALGGIHDQDTLDQLLRIAKGEGGES